MIVSGQMQQGTAYFLDLNYNSLKFVMFKIYIKFSLTYYCSEDVNRCINSAEKGFKIWSTKPITFRVQVLSKFASILRCNGYVLSY